MLFDHAQILFERILEAKTHHVGTRRHNGFNIFVRNIEDIVHELILLGINQAVFGAFVNQQADLLFGIDIVLVGRIVTHQAHHAVGDAS